MLVNKCVNLAKSTLEVKIESLPKPLLQLLNEARDSKRKSEGAGTSAAAGAKNATPAAGPSPPVAAGAASTAGDPAALAPKAGARSRRRAIAAMAAKAS